MNEVVIDKLVDAMEVISSDMTKRFESDVLSFASKDRGVLETILISKLSKKV